MMPRDYNPGELPRTPGGYDEAEPPKLDSARHLVYTLAGMAFAGTVIVAAEAAAAINRMRSRPTDPPQDGFMEDRI